MSVEHPAVDVLCPHGPEEHRAPDLAYAYDPSDDVGVVYDPDNLEAWIAADPDAFAEVGPR
jgi:hypothetical protein